MSGLAIPYRTRVHRTIRLFRAARAARRWVGGPRRDQVQLRALDAGAGIEKLSRNLVSLQGRLAGAVAAAGLPRLPVFSRPRSMVR